MTDPASSRMQRSLVASATSPGPSTRRALAAPPQPGVPAANDEDALYVERIVQLYAVLSAYGLIALLIDFVQGPYLRWGDQVFWPRIVALGVVVPLTVLGAKRWVSAGFLRKTEALVYLLIVAEATVETILSKAPMYAVSEPATVMLFLRACFIPSRARDQALQGGVIVIAVTVGAWFYIRLLGHDLSPFFASAGDKKWLQVGNVLLGGCVFLAITTYVSHTIGKLRAIATDARQMGQYVLESRIGEGGMGEVWRARHALLQRPTAVKVIRGKASDELAVRFEREVRAAAQLTHASSVAIYDFGVADGGRVFYAMELLHGLTLESMVDRSGPMPPERLVHLLGQILGALEEAHLLGLVHRDVKPANIMVIKNGTEHDFPKLLDYGLVHVLRGEGENLALTRKGAVTGTPLYMAPEMITGDTEPDGRTDVYAVGAVGYYLLTGEAPFTGPNATTVMLSHVTKKPVPPSEKSEIAVPTDLEAVILKALEKRPDKRFAGAGEMRAALRRCGCAGAWTEERAAAWWSLHAPALGTPKRSAA